MTLQGRLEALAGAIRDKINVIMPRLLPAGGTTGQALAKNTANPYDVGWIDVGTVTSVSVTTPSSGLSITNSGTTSITATISLANDLAALEALSGVGYAKRTGTDAWSILSALPITDITGLQNALDAKAPLTSPSFLGTPSFGPTTGTAADNSINFNNTNAYNHFYFKSWSAGVSQVDSYIRSWRNNGLVLSGRNNVYLRSVDTDIVVISAAGAAVTGTLTSSGRILGSSTSPITLTSVNHGLQIGANTGTNVSVSNTQIQSRNNGATATLAIQPLGGATTFGGSISATNLSGINTGDQDLSGYATTASLSNYATTASLSNYATTASLSNYATVAALGGKEPTITAGLSSQYWRGDKTWQTLDKSVVGLSNVDNTSDAAKPISTATQAALDALSARITALENASPPAGLTSLAFSPNTLVIGTPSSGTITGATAGSVITSAGLPPGVTVNSAARTWAYDGSVF